MNQKKFHFIHSFYSHQSSMTNYSEENIASLFDLNQSTIIGMTKVEVERLIPLLKNFFEDAKGKFVDFN